jgi:hypothetical protein
MPEELQDLFISHASTDKPRYIQPLAGCLANRQVTFWLDALEVAWGDSIPLRVNEGLSQSRYLLVCLSSNFLRRPWPEAELASALAIQNAMGQKRVLPLILNSKEEVFAKYPLIASLAYREYVDPPDSLVDDIVTIVRSPSRTPGKPGNIRVVIESVHTGKLCNIDVSPRVSVKWLADRAQAGMGVSDRAETGAYEPFRVKWVLVDTKAEKDWLTISRQRQRQLFAVVGTSSGPTFCTNDLDRLNDLGVVDGTVFHLYAVEDERWDSCAHL